MMNIMEIKNLVEQLRLKAVDSVELTKDNSLKITLSKFNKKSDDKVIADIDDNSRKILIMSTIAKDCQPSSLETNVALDVNYRSKYKFARLEWLPHEKLLVVRAEIQPELYSAELISLALRSTIEHTYLYKLIKLTQKTILKSTEEGLLTEEEALEFVGKKRAWIYDMIKVWFPESKLHEMSLDIKDKQEKDSFKKKIVEAASTAGEYLESGDANGREMLENILKSVDEIDSIKERDEILRKIAVKVATAGANNAQIVISKISNSRIRAASYANAAEACSEPDEASKLIKAANDAASQENDVFHRSRLLLSVAKAYAKFDNEKAKKTFSELIESAAINMDKEDYLLFTAECRYFLNDPELSKETTNILI